MSVRYNYYASKRTFCTGMVVIVCTPRSVSASIVVFTHLVITFIARNEFYVDQQLSVSGKRMPFYYVCSLFKCEP